MDLSVRFPPQVLRDYALIADGERGALIGARGDIAWLCAPRWDDDAVFSTLIGGGGVYAVTPDVDRYVWGGHYEPATMIWRSRWVTTDGILESREALAFPGDPDRVVLLRRVCAVEGTTPVRVVLEPKAEFGAKKMRDVRRQDGARTARCGSLYLRWVGAEGARLQGDLFTLAFTLRPGEQRDLILEISDRQLPDELPDPDMLWEATEHSWHQQVPELHDTIARRDAQHAYTVLRGLTSTTGGMVAAATMSLPERAQAGRNYDYRYVWIRDQCYAGQAYAVSEPHPLLDDAVRFVAERLIEDGPELRPAYRVGGGDVPMQRRLKRLKGYPGGADILGNQVRQQFQLDAFGESLLLFAAAARHDRLDAEHWRAVQIAVKAVQQRWTDPDAGIWEIDNELWTHSRLSVVAGLRAIGQHASAAEAGRWSALADKILARTAKSSVHPEGYWQRSPTDGSVDAALLLPGIRGAVPAEDPRTTATIEAVRRELADDHFVYRFRQQPGPLSQAEGAFILCGFVMALAEHQQGRRVEAARYFERNRTACGTPGLFSEEFDVDQRQLRGNIPQAFVHALMLEASRRLAADPA